MSSQLRFLGSTVQARLWALYTLALLFAPWCFDSAWGLSLISQMGVAIIICLSYNILLGQGGMLSFGHAVYSGAGAFASMRLLNQVSGGWPVPVSLIPLAGGLAALLLALVLGWVTTRKSGTAFAMITLAIGELMGSLALMLPHYSGGVAGVSGNRVAGPVVLGVSFGPQRELYYLIAAYTLACTALMYAFGRTTLGCLLVAARENSRRLEFAGYNPHVVRFLAFAVAAFFAGIGGGLAALHFEIVTSEVLSMQRSGAYLLFTVLGGTSLFAGPILGAVLMVLATVWLASITRAWLLYLGLVFVLVVTTAPGGALPWLLGQWRWLRGGAWRVIGWTYVSVLGCAAGTVLSLAALVEMLYRLQLDAVPGSSLSFLGVTLQARDPLHWLTCGAVLLVCAGLLAGNLRRLRRQGLALATHGSPSPECAT